MKAIMMSRLVTSNGFFLRSIVMNEFLAMNRCCRRFLNIDYDSIISSFWVFFFTSILFSLFAASFRWRKADNSYQLIQLQFESVATNDQKCVKTTQNLRWASIINCFWLLINYSHCQSPVRLELIVGWFR